MSNRLFRRLTFQSKDDTSSIRGDSGENAAKLAKQLLKTLEAYMNSKTPEKLADIGVKVGVVWQSVYDVEKATAPQKKFELAEELLLRPDIMRLLLVAFRLVHIDVKRKIRDLYQFIIIFCSNDSADSCVPRSRAKTKFSPKIRDQLYFCRAEVLEVVAEGHDEAASIGFYNDIIREFVSDDVCLMTLLDDDGKDSNGLEVRPFGCIWAVFERLTLIDRKTHIDAFDVTVATFETLQLILGNNHDAVHAFLDRHFARFCQCLQKLITSANFYVQAKSLRLLFDVFTTQRHFEIRSRWLAEPSFLRVVTLALQSNKKPVRTEAIQLLELFIENPDNTPPIFEFISRNKDKLISYCIDAAPVHLYKGEKIEYEDARLGRMVHRLVNWNLQRPFTRKQQEEWEMAEKLQQKMREEQTVPTRFQDFVEGLPTVHHEFRSRHFPEVPFLRDPMQFGQPIAGILHDD